MERSGLGLRVHDRQPRMPARVVFHSKPFPQTRGSDQIESCLGWTFLLRHVEFPIGLSSGKRHRVASIHFPSIFAVHLDAATCNHIKCNLCPLDNAPSSKNCIDYLIIISNHVRGITSPRCPVGYGPVRYCSLAGYPECPRRQQ